MKKMHPFRDAPCKVLSFAFVSILLAATTAHAQSPLDECKSRSAGSFFREVPAQCLYDPANRVYAYRGIDCFSCKRIVSTSSGNNGGGSTNGGGNPNGGGDPIGGGNPNVAGTP